MIVPLAEKAECHHDEQVTVRSLFVETFETTTGIPKSGSKAKTADKPQCGVQIPTVTEVPDFLRTRMVLVKREKESKGWYGYIADTDVRDGKTGVVFPGSKGTRAVRLEDLMPMYENITLLTTTLTWMLVNRSEAEWKTGGPNTGWDGQSDVDRYFGRIGRSRNSNGHRSRMPEALTAEEQSRLLDEPIERVWIAQPERGKWGEQIHLPKEYL